VISIDRARVDAAAGLDEWLASVKKNAELWQAVYRTAQVESSSVDRFLSSVGSLRLVALSEDWCTDAVSTLPMVGRLAEAASVDFRLLGRDANPDLMDAHLTCGTRSIPVVMVVDVEGSVWAWWGPRPASLQRWMRTEGLYLPKDDRTRRKRAWYARDRGRSTVREVIEAVERAVRRRREAGRGD
jgi:hypothetical protein